MHSGYELGNIKEIPIQQVLLNAPARELKNAMAQGEWHAACTWCKQLEDTTGSSGRTVRHADSDTLSAIDQDIEFFKLEHLVVNWSNLCNLTCVYCNPETSTAWQSVKRIPINHVKNEHEDLIELAQAQGQNIQGLVLGGGEPLLQKGLDRFLKFINPDKVRVMVTTNLSMDITTNTIYQTLKTWPNVDWMISFDNANAEKFEYVRDRASWQQFEKNIAVMKQDQQKVIAHPAYSIYCALDLVEYYEYCERHNLDLFWCELSHPWELDIRRYPEALRQLAIQEIDQVVQRWQDHKGLAVDTLKRYRMTLQDNSYLISPDYNFDILEFHKNIEQQLKKSTSFAALWPTIANSL
jgi:organic radical activating enzyme